MVKLVDVDPNQSNLTKSFKHWLMELAETEMTFNILQRIRQENANFSQQNQPSLSLVPPDLVKTYVDVLKDLPEDQRSVALSLIAAMSRPATPVATTVDPYLMLLLLMLRNQNGQQNNNNIEAVVKPIAEAIKGQYTVLAEIVKNSNKGNGNENHAELINSIANLLNAVHKSNASESVKDNLAKLAIEALKEAAIGGDSDKVDELLSFLEKLQRSGLIVDPKTSLQFSLEKEKIEREYRIKEKELEMEEERLNKLGEFFTDLTDALNNLMEKEEKEEGKVREYSVKCPKCGNAITVTSDMPEGEVIQCANCKSKLRLKWKKA